MPQPTLEEAPLVSSSRTARTRAARTAAVLAAGALILGTAACSSGANQSEAASSTSPSASATSGSASPSDAASPSGSGSPKATAKVDVPAISGYTYGAVPDVFATIGDGFTQSGTVDGVATRGVYNAKKKLVAVALVADYTDAVTTAMDAVPATSIAAAVAAAKSGLGEGVKETKTKVGDVTVEVLTSTEGLSVAIAYVPGGSLVEVYGPTSTAVKDVATKLVTSLA
jgi:hypothetical protein